jgi:hypothetical protein
MLKKAGLDTDYLDFPFLKFLKQGHPSSLYCVCITDYHGCHKPAPKLNQSGWGIDSSTREAYAGCPVDQADAWHNQSVFRFGFSRRSLSD